jgi:hypothetical protein
MEIEDCVTMPSSGSWTRSSKRILLALALAVSLAGAALALPALAAQQHARAASSTVVFRAIDRSAGATFHQLNADGTIDTAVSIRVSDTAYRAKTDAQPIQYITIDVWQQDLTTGDYLVNISGVATNPDMGMGGMVTVQVDKNLRSATVTAQVRGYDLLHQQEDIPIAVTVILTADGQATHVSQEYRTQTPTYTSIEHLRGEGFDATVANVSVMVGGVDYSAAPLAFAAIFSESDGWTSISHR